MKDRNGMDLTEVADIKKLLLLLLSHVSHVQVCATP